MLTRRGVAKLSDFGISKQLESTAAVAMTQVGTSAYMAPERLRGERYGWTSDVWSVGVITLEALTSVHPFESARTFISLNLAICEKASPTPPEGTPPEICEFIALCLLKDAGTNVFATPDGAVRPPVRALVSGAWLKQCARSNPIHELSRYLEETMD